MQKVLIIVAGLALLAFAVNSKETRRRKPAWAERFQGWHKIFGILAVIAAFFILLNPELLALGIFGDAAFFDLLVLGLGLQLQGQVLHFARSTMTVLSKILRRLTTPSIGFSYLIAAST